MFQISSELMVTIGFASAVMFLLSLLIVPIIIVRIPDDYFSASKQAAKLWDGHHSALRYLLIAFKNVLGFILLVMGIAMLVLPGQGLLTMLLGIALMDFPGKRNLERRIVSMPKVLKSINWIRAKANQNPLVLV